MEISTPKSGAEQSRLPLRKRHPLLYTTVESILLIIIVYVLVNLLTLRFVVDGASMSPTFETGQYLLVNRLSYAFSTPHRGDVIVLHSPIDSESDLMKRVIGLPGETIEFRSAEVYINGEALSEPYINQACVTTLCGDGIWQVGENEYFVMGDNRNQSRDSRSFGAINSNTILGEVIIRYYPFPEIGWLDQIGLNDE